MQYDVAYCLLEVEWSDFVAACIHLGSDSLEKDLLRVFQDADVDQDGFIVQESHRCSTLIDTY